MSRKTTIDSLFVQRGEPAAPGKSAAAAAERVKTGAISAMGASLKQLTESAKTASRLQEQIAAGVVVIEIEPDRIDASGIADRIPVEGDPGLDALVESLRTSGQQVPVLVRPAADGRYQIAYGRRRLRAAAKLGVKVKALVRNLTDAELVIAQGKENLERRDLSYIERALFARRLEEKGFARPVIMAALSTDKADLSRYLSVARAVPESVVHAIGPAPKTGRPRWVALAEKLAQDPAAAEAAISRPDFGGLDSDSRFAAVWAALQPPLDRDRTPARAWACEKTVRIERKRGSTVLTIDARRGSEFAAYLVDKLDELYGHFRQRKPEEGDGEL